MSALEEESEQRKFVAGFLWNLYRSEQKYRRVIFLAVEEADIWAPQMWDQSSRQSLARVSLIAKHGCKIGVFPIFITQRPADFHKSPLSQCNVILFGRFTSSADLDSRTGIMYVVKKLNHHNPVFTTAGLYGNLMDFLRQPISSAVHVACAVSLLADGNILLFIECRV